MRRFAQGVTGGRYDATVPDSIARPYFLIQPQGTQDHRMGLLQRRRWIAGRRL